MVEGMPHPQELELEYEDLELVGEEGEEEDNTDNDAGKSTQWIINVLNSQRRVCATFISIC
jgi:hypothetical protein